MKVASPKRSHPPSTFMKRPLIALSVAIALALCAAFMAPVPAGLLHGVVLAGSGALLVFFQPCRPLPRMVTVAGAVLFCSSLLAFLPVSWFGVPDWRTHLTSSGVIELGSLVTPQPQHTLAGCFLLAASLATGLFLFTQTPDADERTWLASAFAIGVSAYALLGYFAESTGWIYPGTAGFHSFGFFPNKNHTSSFLMLGGFASLGSFAEWLNRRRFGEAALVAAAAAATLTALLARCNSRAGTLFFAVGLLIWLAWITRRGFERRVIVWCWIAAILVSTVLFASDSAARQRLELLASRAVSGGGSTVESGQMPNPQAAPEQLESAYDSLDFRVLIWKDTLHMIRAQPLAGIGLGNFPYVFPQFRYASRSEALCIHPESSLLWPHCSGSSPRWLRGWGFGPRAAHGWCDRHWRREPQCSCSTAAWMSRGRASGLCGRRWPLPRSRFLRTRKRKCPAPFPPATAPVSFTSVC